MRNVVETFWTKVFFYLLKNFFTYKFQRRSHPPCFEILATPPCRLISSFYVGFYAERWTLCDPVAISFGNSFISPPGALFNVCVCAGLRLAYKAQMEKLFRRQLNSIIPYSKNLVWFSRDIQLKSY